jgi:hypothetical protein
MFGSTVASVAAALAALAAGTALANDSSIPAIDVDAIDTNAKVGTYMSFKGDEAAKLMKALPRISSAGGPVISDHSRALLVQSPGFSIQLSCSDIDWAAPLDNPPAYGTPECTISFTRKNPDINSFPWNPAAQCTPEN